MKKMYFALMVLIVSISLSAQTQLYFNDFNTGSGSATIVGNGQIVMAAHPAFGNVFHNAAGGQGIRSNYMLLPDNVFANLQSSGSKELTIGFWVNKGTAVDYYWTPIFSAYGAAPVAGANTWPMMALQSRGWAQVNCAGWTDFTGAQNVKGSNTESTVWLDDNAWHYYTAVFTETNVKVYIDGVVMNEWNLTGNAAGSSVSGLFSNGSDLKYICLGGNQAWNWGDPDPAYMFDDVAVYASALTQQQISNMMNTKITTSVENTNAGNELIKEEYFQLNGSKLQAKYCELVPGIYLKKSFMSDGSVINSKIMKTDNQ